MKNGLMCQVFSGFSSQRCKTDHPEMRSSDAGEPVRRQKGGLLLSSKKGQNKLR
jgi:hypothetical protein